MTVFICFLKKIQFTGYFWIRYFLGPCGSFSDAKIPKVKFSFFRCLKPSSGFCMKAIFMEGSSILVIFFCKDGALKLHLLFFRLNAVNAIFLVNDFCGQFWPPLTPFCRKISDNILIRVSNNLPENRMWEKTRVRAFPNDPFHKNK